MALLTPSLVRELDRNGMKIGGKEGSSRIPDPWGPSSGADGSPLRLVLIGRLTRSSRKERNGPVKHAARALLAFGILNGYVVAWLVSAQAGVLAGTGRSISSGCSRSCPSLWRQWPSSR